MKNQGNKSNILGKVLIICCSIFTGVAHSANNAIQDVENIDVEGQRLEALSKNVTAYGLNMEMGLEALHANNYERALVRLTESAKQGNKISQFYLASMYFKGLGVPIDNRQGWLWLNVALEQKIPQWRFAYRQIADAIPGEYQAQWQPLVEEYVDKYGAKATDHACRPRREIGSNLVHIICERISDGTYEHRQWRTLQHLFFDVK
ncbi:sel1 repeat family protein [Alteromonas flava]|uniref:sel1 repeat family protein n=1 Tax=Alteromonas flava TaxID=2048003 RepID=UPI000C282575|nr:sel1 repeat family protein [Alteromonas flava]